MANASCVIEAHEPESDDEPWIAGPEDLPDELPRRFMIVAYDQDGDPQVFLWGLQLPGLAVSFGPSGEPLSKSGSAESTHRLASLAYDDVELLWIDPATAHLIPAPQIRWGAGAVTGAPPATPDEHGTSDEHGSVGGAQ